jgi:hypothetical protein
MTSWDECTGGVCLLAVMVKIVSIIRDTLKDYWFSLEQFYVPFYSNLINCDQILIYFHFTILWQYEWVRPRLLSCGRVQKSRIVFDKLSDGCASEHLAVSEAILLFKGRSTFKQTSLRNIYALLWRLTNCVTQLAAWSVLGKERQNAAQTLTGSHAVVSSLAARVEGVVHTFYLASFFSSTDLFDGMYTRNYCGTVI